MSCEAVRLAARITWISTPRKMSNNKLIKRTVNIDKSDITHIYGF